MRSLTLERMSADRPDEQLVNAARAGDRAAFSALFARDRDLVYAYAYARLLNREDAEDAMQDTFIRAYQSLGRLRGPGAWQAWLMQITRNLCSDALRRKRVRRTEPVDPEWLDGGPSPEMLLVTAERILFFKKQHIIQVKELKFRPNTDDHDYEFKKNHAIRFLKEGNRVKAVVQFRGREIAHVDLGKKLLMRFAAGRTRREIAVALGVPESTIIGRMARAMRLLRRQLGEEWRG